MKKTIIMVACVLLLSITCYPNPQVIDTVPMPASIQLFELLPDYSPWMTTSNNAAINDIHITGFSYFKTGMTHKDDEIRYSHQPGRTTSFNVETSGFKKISRFSFLGSFEYLNESYQDLKYNSTLIFDSWNPYIIGDTISGLQNKEQFNLKASIGYKLSSKLSLALGADYVSATGAKQKDPRNLNTIADLTVSSGIVYDLDRFKLGLSAAVYNFSDYTSISIEGNLYKRVFEFLGLGAYRAGVESSSYSNWYLGKGYSGSLQASYETPGFNDVAEVMVKSAKEETRSGSAYRLLDGITSNIDVTFSNRMRLGKNGSYHFIDIFGSITQLNSDEYSQRIKTINHFDDEGKVSYTTTEVETLNSAENKNIITSNTASLKYKYLRLYESGMKNYEAGAGVTFDNFSRGHYPVSNNGLISSNNLTFELNARKTIHFAKMFFSPSLYAFYRMNLSSEISFRALQYYFPGIIINDYNNMCATIFGGKVTAEIEKPLSKGFVSSLFLKPEYSYYYSPDFGEESRANNFFGVSLGCAF